MRKKIRKPSISSGMIINISTKRSYIEIEMIDAHKGGRRTAEKVAFHQGGLTEIKISSQKNARNTELKDHEIRFADAKPGFTSDTTQFYVGRFCDSHEGDAQKVDRLIKFLNANAFKHDDRIDNQTSKNTIEKTYTF